MNQGGGKSVHGGWKIGSSRRKKLVKEKEKVGQGGGKSWSMRRKKFVNEEGKVGQ